MFSFFIFLISINLILFQINIPFITIKDNITTDSPSTFMFFFFPNKIETKIKIGTPYQEISLRLKTLLSPLSINSVKMGTFNIIRFNESNSSTYFSLSDIPTYFGEDDFINAIKSKETIYFKDKLLLNNITFLLGIKENLYRREGGILGLNIPEFDIRIQEVGFIKQLKQRDLIKKYIYYIKYNESNESGDLIIGSLPHEIDSKKFEEKKYDEFNAEIVSSTMGLKVTEAYYGQRLMDCEFKVELAVEENFIRGTEIIKKILNENFFEEKIARKICESSIFSYIDNENEYFYYCSKKLNLSDFKNITLFIADSDLKIELSYHDLFYEYKDNYYFMMYFPTKPYSNSYFRLGKVLFQKYILIFNHDNKKIGYYRQDYKGNNKNEEEKTEKEEKNKIFNQDIIQWIIIVILVIMVGILSFIIIYYKPWKKREKRANELQDDNFCYQGINSDGKLNIN